MEVQFCSKTGNSNAETSSSPISGRAPARNLSLIHISKLKCTVQDFEEVKRAVDYLKAHSLNSIEDLDTAISNLNQTAAPLRRQLKQNENRMRTIAQIRDAAAVHAKLKPIHDTFMKKNFKLTKDAYAAQHKEELDTFNKAVRTLMKLNGSTTVDFSALDAEFAALQSGSAEPVSYTHLDVYKRQILTPGKKNIRPCRNYMIAFKKNLAKQLKMCIRDRHTHTV